VTESHQYVAGSSIEAVILLWTDNWVRFTRLRLYKHNIDHSTHLPTMHKQPRLSHLRQCCNGRQFRIIFPRKLDRFGRNLAEDVYQVENDLIEFSVQSDYSGIEKGLH